MKNIYYYTYYMDKKMGNFMNHIKKKKSKAQIGNETYLGDNITLYGEVKIGKNCFIGDNVSIGYPNEDQIKKLINKTKINSKSILINKIEATTKIGNETIIQDNSIIGSGTKIGEKAWIDFNTIIGSNCKIGNDVSIEYGAKIYNSVIIGNKSTISGFVCDRAKIGNNVFMKGQLVHKFNIPKRGIIEPSPIIEDYVIVGWNAIIIGPIIIGRGAYIGAGAIITKDVRSETLVINKREPLIKERNM